MTELDDRLDTAEHEPATGETTVAGSDVAGPAEAAAPRARRSWKWWLGRVALVAVLLGLVLTLAGLVVYDFGTMSPPSPEVEAEYQALVAQGKASPEQAAPGPRIPIPGCVCHAADPDLAQKAPGHAPDPILVITHRYRTFSECFSPQCHGGKSEASEGIVPGEPGNQPVIPAQ
jgi:hypothetical protein